MDYEDKCLIANSIRSFCLSAHTSFVDYAESIELSSNISELCISYLSQMQDGTIDCTHDFYLKLFHLQLANESITFDNFDLLMIDEAGDLNEVTFAIFNLLPATRKLMVGDVGQNIYTFNHTVNCFDLVRDSATFFPMTQSFRVSQSIASRIESFGIKYLSPDFKFVGIPDQPNPDIVTRAFISRTNAGLIAKMIELNDMGIPYGLVRDPKAIFELPLLLMSLKPRGFIGKNEFKFLQTDYDDWTKSPTLRDQYKSPLSFIGSQHPDDVQLQTAIRLLGTHGASEIMSCYNEAKHHRKSNQSYQLGTAFVFKGLEVDEVIIADDLNQSMSKVVELLADGFEMTPDMTTICNLAYVAASRARHKLANCNYL